MVWRAACSAYAGECSFGPLEVQAQSRESVGSVQSHLSADARPERRRGDRIERNEKSRSPNTNAQAGERVR